MKRFFVSYEDKVLQVPDNMPLYQFLNEKYHMSLSSADYLKCEPCTFSRGVFVYRVRILSSLNTFLYFIGNNNTCVYDISEIMKEKNLCASKLG